MTHYETADLGPRRKLERGDEADVQFNGRKTRTRAKFLHVHDNGDLTFVDPTRNSIRTVKPDAVGTIHRKSKLRGASDD